VVTLYESHSFLFIYGQDSKIHQKYLNTYPMDIYKSKLNFSLFEDCTSSKLLWPSHYIIHRPWKCLKGWFTLWETRRGYHKTLWYLAFWMRAWKIMWAVAQVPLVSMEFCYFHPPTSKRLASKNSPKFLANIIHCVHVWFHVFFSSKAILSRVVASNYPNVNPNLEPKESWANWHGFYGFYGPMPNHSSA